MKLTLITMTMAAALTGSFHELRGQARIQAPDILVEAPPAEPALHPGSPRHPKAPSGMGGRVTFSPKARAFFYDGAERGSRPLIVQTQAEDAKAMSQLQEDLAVMSRILEKTVSEYQQDQQAAGIPIVTLDGGSNSRALYLEDYGVLFTFNVNFPLEAETRTEESDDEEKRTAANAEWTEARNELFGSRFSFRRDRLSHALDAEQLEEFRAELINALRNATNIRNLRDSDWITIVVRGRDARIGIGRHVDVLIPGKIPLNPADNDPFAARDESSTMVLRVKKSDVDQFANESMNADDFAKKVAYALY